MSTVKSADSVWLRLVGDPGKEDAKRPGERSVGGLGFGVALGGELEDLC